MDEETGVMGRLTVEPRSRSYSTGTMPMSHRHKMAESNRIRARLEASTVGLGELLLLKQNQHRNIESVKAMLMSNLPMDDRIKSEKMFQININIPTVVVEEECTLKSSLMDGEDNRMSSVGDSNDSQLEDSGYGESLHTPGEPSLRKRSVSMDVSVARSLALTAKKLARIRSKEAHSQHATTKPEGSARGGRKRTNSHNDPTRETPDTAGTPRGDGKYKHRHKDSHNGSNSKMEKNLPFQRERGSLLQPDKYIDFSMDRSLSGSFLSLESSPKSFPSSPEYFNLPVNESMFDGHFKSPRSLSNSKLIFEFPSPMHAILLHFDKTKEPVLNGNKITDDSLSPKSKGLQYSPKRFTPERRFLHKSNVHHKYGLRKDSSVGDTSINIPPIYSLHNNNSFRQKELFPDDGVSAFIEMLANRGIAKRKREEIEKEKLKIRNENNSTQSKSGMMERNSDLSDSSLKLSDDSMGGWDGPGLSSSGKRGSRVSVRSSASSKASLSSEEGYYSHPGSPKNKRDHEKCSLQASVSTTSLSATPQSEGTEISDDPLHTDDSNGDVSEKIENDNGKMEIITLPDSPGAKRRRSGLNSRMGKSAVILASSSETLGIAKDGNLLRCHSAPNSPNKTQRGHSQFTFNAELNTPKFTEKRSKSAEAVPIITLTDLTTPSPVSRVPEMSDGLTDLKLAQNECKKASLSKEEHAPSGNNGATWSKYGPMYDSPSMFQRVHCLESPSTPTIKEEPRIEGKDGDVNKTHPLALTVMIPSDEVKGESELRSPPICQAPKVPSWRKKNKVKDQVNKPTMKRSEMHDKTVDKVPTKVDTDSPKSKLESGSALSQRYSKDMTTSDRYSPPQRTYNKPRNTLNINNSKENIPVPASPARIDEKRGARMKKTHLTLPVGGELRRENIFQYPTQAPQSAPVPSSTPTRKDIPEILKNWVESKTPILTDDQKVKPAAHSKSSSLPVPMGLQPLTPTLSPIPHNTGMSLTKSKRFYKSQEIFPREDRMLGERQISTLDRAPRGSPPGCNVPFGNHKTSHFPSSKPVRVNRGMVNMKVEINDQNHNMLKMPAANVPNMYNTSPRARSSSWSKGHCPSLPSKKNSWVREIVVPCNSPRSKPETTRPRSASFSLNTNKLRPQGSSSKPHMVWYQGRSDVNDTFV